MLETLKGFISDHSIVIAITTATTNLIVSQIESVTAPLVAILSIIILTATAIVKVEEAYQKIKTWRLKLNSKIVVEKEVKRGQVKGQPKRQTEPKKLDESNDKNIPI